MTQQTKVPSFLHSAITFGAIMITIAYGFIVLKTSLHGLMLMCLTIAGSSAWLLTRGNFREIRYAMNSGLSQAFGAIYIFFMIGILLAALIQAGTVATLIYYGLQFISPALFLPVGLICCSVMSLATGTSWGTVGTIGVALMGIGTAMQIPLPIVAGMVISGACFGDKMSPISDTTNLASMAARTELYSHIRVMSYTTIPVYLLVLMIFTLIGQSYGEQAVSLEHIQQLGDALKNVYQINVLTLLPLLVIICLSLGRIAPEPSMLAATLVAILLAFFMQDIELKAIISALYQGSESNSGLDVVDNLLKRGGILSMLWTLSLALMALALGGILQHYGFLRVLITVALLPVKKPFGLLISTFVSGVIATMTLSESYISIILTGQLFIDAYGKLGIDRLILSRTLEEGITLIQALIPWTTGGAFFASMLGINALEYAPWALLNWMNPLFSILLALFGLALSPSHKEKHNKKNTQ